MRKFDRNDMNSHTYVEFGIHEMAKTKMDYAYILDKMERYLSYKAHENRARIEDVSFTASEIGIRGGQINNLIADHVLVKVGVIKKAVLVNGHAYVQKTNVYRIDEQQMHNVRRINGMGKVEKMRRAGQRVAELELMLDKAKAEFEECAKEAYAWR